MEDYESGNVFKMADSNMAASGHSGISDDFQKRMMIFKKRYINFQYK